MVPLLAPAATLLVLLLAWIGRRPERFSLLPLGLGASSRRVKAHALLRTDAFASLDEWVKQLPRGARATARKAEARYMGRGGGAIAVPRGLATAALGWEHFAVVLDHERRLLNPVAALMAALLRITVARCMVGAVDEVRSSRLPGRCARAHRPRPQYREDGRLVAWAQTVCKGSTLRGMWFYCRGSHSKQLIWYGTIVAAVSRAVGSRAPRIRYVDLGPSGTAGVASAKARFGFENTTEWVALGCYDGAFAPVPELRT